MPKKLKEALGKFDVYMLDPDVAVLVEDAASALYDERVKYDYNENLVLNMMYAPDGSDGIAQGVLVPVLGRRNTETGKIEIIDGRQRTKAAREANKRLKKQGRDPIRLPVHVKRASDVRAMAALISTNEHRTEDTPMGKAKKAQRFIEMGRDEDEVATLLGVSKATVTNLLKLLDAPAVVRHAVDAGKITASDAYKLSREEPEEAKKKLDQLLTHAPRTPGKKRSRNAGKAAEITGRKPAGGGGGGRKLENEIAEKIAAWIDASCDSLAEVPERIRKGEWRKFKPAKDAADAAE